MSQSTSAADVVVVGAGIVGLATAYQLSRRNRSIRIVVVEKEPSVALHQTGRNSGVLHSGIYYTPGTLKAVTCRLGKAAMEAFCQEHGIAWERCGKVIVAVDESELPALERIESRGEANGVVSHRIDRQTLNGLEPHVAGIAALHVPETGIVDYIGASRKLAELIVQTGGQVQLGSRLRRVQSRGKLLDVHLEDRRIETRSLINCAGLHCDQVMLACGLKPPIRIVPFRGEYFTLDPSVWGYCRNLIYPVPDPTFPFLGVLLLG